MNGQEEMYAMFQAGRQFELNKDERDSLIGAEEAFDAIDIKALNVEFKKDSVRAKNINLIVEGITLITFIDAHLMVHPMDECITVFNSLDEPLAYFASNYNEDEENIIDYDTQDMPDLF